MKNMWIKHFVKYFVYLNKKIVFSKKLNSKYLKANHTTWLLLDIEA